MPLRHTLFSQEITILSDSKPTYLLIDNCAVVGPVLLPDEVPKSKQISKCNLQSAGSIQTLYFFMQVVIIYPAKHKMASKLQR